MIKHKSVKCIIVCVLLLINCFMCALFCSCVPKTEYDDKTIAKIQTSSVDFGPSPSYLRYHLREVDFVEGKVVDTVVADFDNADDEEMQGVDKNYYNNPKVVATFTREQATDLYNKIRSLGFFAWKEEYVTNDPVCDGGSNAITVYFTDGTVKSTYIFIKKPPQYDKIYAAFKEYIGVGLCCGDGPISASKVGRFEFYQLGFKTGYYADYSEMSDMIGQLKSCVISQDKNSFFEYVNSLKANANAATLVCPFLFSSSESVMLSDVTAANNCVYVSFDVYSPECCDCDIRMYVFFVNASDLAINKTEPLQIKYVINNLAGGEGSYYYPKS